MEPPPDDVYLAEDLKKALQQATKLQKKKGDSFLGERRVDLLYARPPKRSRS